MLKHRKKYDRRPFKFAIALSTGIIVFLVGCQFEAKKSTSSSSSSSSSSYSSSSYSSNGNGGGFFANGSETAIQAGDIKFVIRDAPFSLVTDLAPMVQDLKSSRLSEKKLVCAQTLEIIGLFFCIGTVEAAHHGPLNRAAIFAEGRPVIGVPSAGTVVSPQTGFKTWSRSFGHDIPQYELETFFSVLKSICLGSLECMGNYELRFANDVLPRFSMLAPAGYSVISMDVESDASIEAVRKHEIAHGQFFQQPLYQSAVYNFWNSLPLNVKEAAISYLSYAYDTRKDVVLVNEFHAYILDRSFERMTSPKTPAEITLYTNAKQLRTILVSMISAHAMPIWSDRLQQQ